ncbi:glycosyltransferase family 39 protein, partial [Streptomyces sp. NPDC048659]|uniref:glycosyltransferase family 39 protein n=1 Tax=Streptomyces sp. NPDC048659 TaxID=3155489 RepID=UPI003446545C
MATPAPAVRTGAAPAADRSARPARPRAEECRRAWPVALGPGLLALALGLYGAGRPQLWEDELTSWELATRSTGRLLDTVQHVDAVLAAYYLLLHAWTGLFGDSDLALRLPSVLAAAGAAACTALVGRRLFGRRAGLAAGLLLALTPALTRYAQEARPYALVTLAAALATLLLLRALDRPDGTARWAAYALAVAATGALHLLALTALTGHAALVLAARTPPPPPITPAPTPGRRTASTPAPARPTSELTPARPARPTSEPAPARLVRPTRPVPLRRFVVAVLLGCLPLVPLALLGRAQAGRQIAWIPEPDPAALAGLWPQLFGAG